ncbi:MAG: hypothetical protein EA365_12455 [Gloeocapsa sp. DLM2.Bin57]|nr:MAG: hypothetical protein EA365_12455 [Gloeocapsa sp. DLM2.Bin57]
MDELTILVAGFSGLSCAYHFPGKTTIYEARDNVGGTAGSMEWEGFTFDYGPHISFTKDTYVQKLLAQGVKDEYVTKQVSNGNYYQGHWVRHPAICNLCDLPPETNRDALLSFIETKERESEIQNYRDWCELGQGKYFAENFTHIYTEKFWTVKPEEMTYQWVGERVAKPTLKRVIDGSLGLQTDTGYYFTEFRYPKVGGYGSYSNFWLEAKDRVNLKLNHRVTKIDLNKRILSFANQQDQEFGETLITSLPLPEFISLVVDVPESVQEAVTKLRCTSIALINIALNEQVNLPYHWFYVYDPDILTPRISIYSNISELNAPEGCTSLQAEVPYSNTRPLPVESLVERVLDDLQKMKMFNPDSILKAWQVNVKYGYVIYDQNREASLNIIHDWMRSKNVEPVGRFGLWQYLWSDQAIKSGKKLIESKFLVT